jgi:hypothetical protein
MSTVNSLTDSAVQDYQRRIQQVQEHRGRLQAEADTYIRSLVEKGQQVLRTVEARTAGASEQQPAAPAQQPAAAPAVEQQQGSGVDQSAVQQLLSAHMKRAKSPGAAPKAANTLPPPVSPASKVSWLLVTPVCWRTVDSCRAAVLASAAGRHACISTYHTTGRSSHTVVCLPACPHPFCVANILLPALCCAAAGWGPCCRVSDHPSGRCATPQAGRHRRTRRSSSSGGWLAAWLCWQQQRGLRHVCCLYTGCVASCCVQRQKDAFTARIGIVELQTVCVMCEWRGFVQQACRCVQVAGAVLLFCMQVGSGDCCAGACSRCKALCCMS